MKYKLLLIIPLLFTIVYQYTNAQIINICGSDTIILKTGNYESGSIQWQESLDNENWIDIEGANDTTYTFYPEESKYYRAKNCFSGCPNGYSNVSHIQLPPVAYAGTDRVISAESVELTGNISTGTLGTWKVLSGANGSFTDINDPHTTFQGNDSTYLISWTNSNTCGSSIDTVKIEFVKNEYIKNIAIIDTTDIILSDSNQLENGIYRIQFGASPPTINDSTVLIGIGGEGFIRVVDSFTFDNNIYTIQTTQGSLSDITINGAFNFGDLEPLSSSLKSTSDYHTLDHLPTRIQLTTNPKFKNKRFVYSGKDQIEYIRHGVSYNKNTLKTDILNKPLIGLEFNDTIWSNDYANLRLSGYYEFNPNIVVDFNIKTKWYGRPYLKSFKAGMYNATIKSNYQITFDASAEANLVDKTFELFSKSKTSVFVIGGVPVTVKSKLTFEGALSVDVDASIHVEHGQSHTSTYTSAIEYYSKDWHYLYNKKEEHEMNNNVEVNGNLTQHFEIGPTVSFKVYGVVGPYIDARLNEDFEICAGAGASGLDSGYAGWQANLDIGGSITVGAKAKVAKIDLFDIQKTFSKGFYHLQFPSKLSLVTGNNQFYDTNTQLSKPITIKAKSNKGFAIPGTIIYFDPQNGGSVNPRFMVTDLNGEASTNWTPGGENLSTLEITATDCDGNNLNKSPINVYSYSNSAGLACSNSSLSASLVHHNIKLGFNYYELKGNLGSPPYTYSTDGINYTSTKQKLYSYEYKDWFNAPGKTYMFYVKDSNGCLATTSYTIGNCKNSGLTLNTSITGDIVSANTIGGTKPYSYSINDLNGSYSSDSIFSNISPGSYTFYVKDNVGCIASNVQFVPVSTPPILADFTVDKIHVSTNDYVEFEDLSNNATEYLWDFGDGLTSTEEAPKHMYSTPGLYTVQLIASNSTSSDTLIHNNMIDVGLAPEANFVTEQTNIAIGDTVYFTNTSKNSPAKYLWNFGDEATSTDANPKHLYSTPGTYSVSLSVKNKYGNDSILFSNLIIVNEANTFTDIRDNHVYGYVTIGNQTWMTENLAFLPSVNNPMSEDYWEDTTSVKYYVYGYEGSDVSAAKSTNTYANYGVYYNYKASETAAPEGWHIPTIEEWQELLDYVATHGYEGKEGNALKSCRQVNSVLEGNCNTTEHPRWNENSWEYGLDAFGFSALPGGEPSGEMGFIGEVGMWWAQDDDITTIDVPFFSIDSRNEETPGKAEILPWGYPILGYSIRCIKDK